MALRLNKKDRLVQSPTRALTSGVNERAKIRYMHAEREIRTYRESLKSGQIEEGQ